MHHSPAGGVGQAVGHLNHVQQGFADGQPASTFEDGAQVLAFNELEGDEVQPLVFPTEEGWKRRMFSSSPAISGGRIFSATKRSSWVSRARRTAAIPPTPIDSISSK
jgi:hypothetical protein